MRRLIALAAGAVALALPAAASAHVTVQPSSAAAGGFTRLDVRVPNERDDAGTIKVDVKLPPGFIFASYEPVPGWDVKVIREKLDEPVATDEGFEVDEQVSRIVWTGHGSQGVIGPGQFRDFGLSVAIPDGKPGDKLTFKALQTYQGGEVVRWIGAPDSDEAAPQLTLTAAEGESGHGAPASGQPSSGANASAPATAAGDDDSGDGLATIALIVGALGLLAGLAALVAARRSSNTATTRPQEVR
jgi:uncharacterized protein YcnI